MGAPRQPKREGESATDTAALWNNSASTRDVSYNPEHHNRMKHVQRRHFFVRDMVESFEIELPYVRTSDNLADFFTKPLKSASQFHTLRKRHHERALTTLACSTAFRLCLPPSAGGRLNASVIQL